MLDNRLELLFPDYKTGVLAFILIQLFLVVNVRIELTRQLLVTAYQAAPFSNQAIYVWHSVRESNPSLRLEKTST